MKKLVLALATGIILQTAVGAAAKGYPSRPITMIVPFPAGGPSDVVGRIMADGMRRSLEQSVVVEDIGGAGGTIGMGRVARAKPDGYTIGLGSWNTGVVNGAIYRLDYDVVADFEPVVLLPDTPLLIASKRAVPANNLQELIAWVKANGDKVLVGTSGVGTSPHVAGVMLQQANRRTSSARALPRRRAGAAGPDCRPY